MPSLELLFLVFTLFFLHIILIKICSYQMEYYNSHARMKISFWLYNVDFFFYILSYNIVCKIKIRRN